MPALGEPDPAAMRQQIQDHENRIRKLERALVDLEALVARVKREVRK